MNLDLLQNLDFKKNRFLRGAPQILTTEPVDPILGELLVYDSTAPAAQAKRLAVYDSINEGSPFSTWRLLAGLNRNDEVTGLWSWRPPIRGGGIGSGAPFVLSGPTAFNPNPGTHLQNWTQHLNADYLDGRGAEEWADAAPSGLVIPVANTTGQLRVNDPVKDFDAVNRRTLLATAAGLVVVAPCKAATVARLAGARSGNVITASANGVYAPDGVTLALSDRVLLKDQEQGGTGVDNGIYTVTTLGTASVPVVLTRAADADATGELTVGTLVFVSSGTVNAATQWSCQRPPGTGGGSIIAINSDIQLWQKTFGQSAYTEGRGIKFNGLEINFCQITDYTVGSIFWASGAKTVAPIVPPGAAQFLKHTGAAGTAPLWASIGISDISDWPDVVTAPGLGVTPRIARFSGTTQITDSKLEDVTGTIRAWGNSVLSPTTGLGDNTHPFGFLWTSLLRLKPTAGSTAGTTPVLNLLGIQSDANDSNTDHKTVVTWGVAAVKNWLGFSASDIAAVPSSRQLTFVGDTLIQVATPTQDLSADRTWNLSLNTATLDARWVTVATAQDVTAVKRWKAGSASTALIELWATPNAVPSLSITAGGSVQWGDGLVAPFAGIQLQNDRLTVSGKAWEFASTSQVKFTSAITTTGAPTFVLGLDASDMVRRVNLGDLLTYTGVPLLAANAVGYGDASGRLTGNAATLRFDFTAGQEKLGIRCTPASTLDVLGTFNLSNTVTSGPFPGGLIGVVDNSASNADWNSRSLYGLYVSANKNGAATFIGSANLYAITGTAVISNGSVSGLVGVRANINIGAAAGGPTVNNVWAFYSTSATPAGIAGTIGAYTHFHADSLSTMPQPGEHYGFRCVNLASGAGASRTAGLRLDLVSTGLGQRFNIYAPGDAVSYFAGPIGLGVTLTPAVTSPPSAITPTARLEFAVGTTTLAPIRFAPTSALTSLLSPPLAGHLESTGDRLNFTDTVPSRHALAFYDDLGFTNDSSATPVGGVIFDQSAHMLAALDLANSIGQGDFTLWARFRMPAAFRGPNVDGVCGVSSSSSTGLTYNNAAKIVIGSAGQVYFYISTDSGNYRVLKTVGLFFSVYGGKVVDVLVVRKGSAAPTLYLNGTAQAVTDTPGGATPPTWDMAVNSSYLHAGKDDTGGGSVPEIIRVAFFNYAMTSADALDVSRQGRVASADKYGSMTGMTVTNGGFEGGFAAGVPNGWTKGGAVTTADEAAIFHGGAHAVRFTAGGLPSTSSNNWFYLSALVPLKRHLVQAWAQRVSGTGNLSIGAGYQSAALGAMGGTISSAGTWARFGGVCRAEGGQTGGLYNTYLTLAGWTALDVWLIDDVTVQQVGAIAEMDFSVGCGSVIPDRSGRYPGTLTPAQPTAAWDHAISTCPLEVASGSGTIARGLRRFTQTISAKDGDLVTVTHSLGTQNLTVAVWNAAGASVACAVNRKASDPTNAVELGFALIGAPTPPGTTVNLLVVIIG